MSVPDSYGLSTTTVTVDLPTPRRALAIGAHPDDVEFGCGATLAKWAADGCEVFHLVLTDGSKGTWDPSVDPAALVVTRQREQRAAARVLTDRAGNDDDHVVFLGWIDGELDSGLRQRWEVAYWIRRIQPDVMLGHDPWRRYRIHPDHRNAGFLTTDGIVAARDPKFFPEQQLAPHRPSTLLLWEADEPDHVESASAATLDRKLRALLAHESQYESTMRMPSASALQESSLPQGEEPEAIGAFRATIESRAQQSRALSSVELGEVFKRIDRL
jgi:LmbE family N-acetylglucosaminyl deacetylase